MQLNFFTWLREGVKQAVLLGVSDAVEQLGSPETDEEVNPQLAGLLRSTDRKRGRKSSTSANAAGRKALGRTLKDVQQETT